MRWDFKGLRSLYHGRTKFTTNIINIFVLGNPLPNHQELVRDKICQIKQLKSQ